MAHRSFFLCAIYLNICHQLQYIHVLGTFYTFRINRPANIIPHFQFSNNSQFHFMLNILLRFRSKASSVPD